MTADGLIGFVFPTADIVGGLILLIGGFILGVLYDNKKKKHEDRSARLNPDLNVVRHGEGSGRLWDVNPHWIDFEGDTPVLLTWRSMQLLKFGSSRSDGAGGAITGFMSLSRDDISSAVLKKNWLVFCVNETTLTLHRYSPCRAEDGHLFNQLTKRERRKLQRSHAGR